MKDAKMRIEDLPVGSHPPALSYPHFPTRQQAFVWRNWEMVPVSRLAAVLGTTEENVTALAGDLGLAVPQSVSPLWLTRGYLKILRSNWHLLPYEQLTRLLGVDAEGLDHILREDDYPWWKLGQLKPAAEPIVYRPLSAEEAARTREIREMVRRHFPDLSKKTYEPFGFLREFSDDGGKAPAAVKDGRFNLRMLYSYAAVYGDSLLNADLDSYPPGLLRKYAETGVNAVWLPGVVYKLVPWDRAPEMSEGYRTRLANLRALTEKAARYGIGVFLYINEPRTIPFALADRFQDLKGWARENVGMGLCTSKPEVLDYLRNAMTTLFKEVPLLAGIFTITMSENPTNCHSDFKPDACPICSNRPVAEVIAELNNAIVEGVRAGSPTARAIVWNWAWSKEWALDAIDRLRPDAELMSVSEWGLPTEAGGVKGEVVDYSISKVGPAPYALDCWRRAKARGMKTIAKIQVNNTWELSAVPFNPAVYLVEEHLRNLDKAGVDGLMLSWTLGGYPSLNLELTRKSADALATERFGEAAAPSVRAAWRAFGDAFREFPFNQTTIIYKGPQNYGPMNLLWEKPTGYRATSVTFPYDDLTTWRQIFPEDVFEDQFRKIVEGWELGLAKLAAAAEVVQPEYRRHLDAFSRVAEAAFCHFRSAYDQIRFVRRRDKPNAEIMEILDREIDTAKRLFAIVHADSRIGFEASNHYYYTRNDLMEKVVSCEFLKEKFEERLKRC